MSRGLIKLIGIITTLVLILILPAEALASTPKATGEATTGANAGVKTAVTATNGAKEKGTPLEALNVSYWPEYDKPAVLVMYRGRIDASIKTPTKVKIAIPKGADVRLTACSTIDTNDQFQYDRAWSTKEIVDAGDMSILTYETAYPDFQFEIYMKPISGKGKRSFDFALPSISDIKTLNVDIKKPVRAENFKATPVAAETQQDGQFENHLYSFANIVPGQNLSFDVTYDRADSMPSIDSNTGEVSTSGGSQRTTLFIILLVVLVGSAVGVGVWRMSSSAAAPVAKPVAKSGGKTKSKKKTFCSQCGEELGAKTKFCPGCGKSL